MNDSRSRIGSLGRRMSFWLALQALFGLVVICSGVYGAIYLSFQARQSQELEDKQSLLHHLLTESSRDADWTSPDFPDTSINANMAAGGVRWQQGHDERLQRSSSVRR